MPRDTSSDSLTYWDERVTASRWLIAKTAAWGVLAGFFAVLGQGWLEDAQPIFPFIQQNFSLWQIIYLLALVLVFVLWAAAMQQKITILHNSKVGRAAQQRVVDFNARQAQRKQEALQRREQALREKQAEAANKAPQGGRSNKFDF
ncbi:hypothetical protein ACFFKC_03620 [Pseudoduganella danionis]|uniref:Uncharacterized protein n=1 Tax=Pseudoduganella danionis TaxID=1890295 RepID=A0ABW9SIM5_9BURK|nr:hypothetical protein [Pseudoduganella danionis]MTW31401.1 hypothetical protein [Pseudoduganella danionis]